MKPGRRTRILLAALGVLAAGCSDPPPEPDPTPSAELAAVVASYDLAADRPQRVMVGLPVADGRTLSFGTVDLAFTYTGTEQDQASPLREPGPRAEAAFLAVPGTEPAGPQAGPALTTASQARGVYAARDVDFAGRAGFWEVLVTAEVHDVGTLTATTTFVVGASPQRPAPGDRALRTKNHLPGAPDIDLTSIDSAALEGALPDPHLHTTTIAAAIAAKRPALVIFSTPVWCVSKFCGPVTDVVAGLALAHEGEAEFIHVEIWKDFQGRVLNRAAADWVGDPTQGEELTEPWLFLIGANGRILERWDNLFDLDEVEAALRDAA
ncbi:MAG: hypothetical protein WD770_11355 [Actinomycetota bacterium]